MFILLASISLCLIFATGCAAAKLDPTAESIVITDLSQLKNQDFAGFEQLKSLDLRGVSVDAATVDALQVKLPNATILWKVPLGVGTFDNDVSELALPQDCTANELSMLRYFPLLTHVDATRCAVDQTFADAAANYSNVAFSWNASIGGVSVTSGDTTLDLTGHTISLDEVKPFLLGLSSLQQVICTNTGWSAEEIATLQTAYPAISFISDVDVFGEQMPTTTQELDFTGKTVDLDQLPEGLKLLPELTSVNLVGQQVSFEQMDALTTAFPQISFSFSFELFSQQVTTQTTELNLNGYALTSPEEIADKLKYLPNLTKADLSGCGLSNEQMEQLIAQFPSVKFVWVIKIGAWEVRTDITAFSKGNRKTFPNGMGSFTGEGKSNFNNDDIQVLKYLTDLVYLDLGHGNRISDVTVISQLKHLRVLILSMNKIEDISPLAQLKELECLEIYQNPIKDISPVAELPKLKYLNCSSTYIEDITPLLGLQNLEMLWFIRVRNISEEQRQQLSDTLKNCNICYSANSSGDGGWTNNGLYVEYQKAFGLPY
jgi:Leucine-rich repeat (LRR) protein